VPLAVPLVFITRSFAADFVRSLMFRRGIGTFDVNASRLGRLLVASPASRAVYLVAKFAVFFLGAFVLWRGPAAAGESGPAWVRPALWWGALAVTGMNLTRFAVLLHDSRTVLREELGA
jgi:phosphatidylglycerophosphate synthase